MKNLSAPSVLSSLTIVEMDLSCPPNCGGINAVKNVSQDAKIMPGCYPVNPVVAVAVTVTLAVGSCVA